MDDQGRLILPGKFKGLTFKESGLEEETEEFSHLIDQENEQSKVKTGNRHERRRAQALERKLEKQRIG